VEELRQALKLPGISLGCHSVSHLALDRIPSDMLRTELLEPFRWFEEHDLAFDRVLAYPYGLMSDLVATEAAKAGYESAWLAEGGWSSTPRIPPHSRPRLSIGANSPLGANILQIAEL
jgi:peptidoglycan/xylan/chitin deacetylase (PgdA/CDA1 family)